MSPEYTSIQPFANIPDHVPVGGVRGFFVSFLADGGGDGIPDEVVMNGTVTITPRVAYAKFPDTLPPRTAFMEPIQCPVINGWMYPPGTTIEDYESRSTTVYLAATEQPTALPDKIQYHVSFRFSSTTGVDPAPIVVEIPAGEVVDLARVIPSAPAAGTVHVTTTEERERAEAAAQAAVEARDAARGSADAAHTAEQAALTQADLAEQSALDAAASALAAAGSATTAQNLADAMSSAIATAVAAAKTEILGKTILRDTGWINIHGELLNDWTCSLMRIRRIGNQVFLETYGLNGNSATGDTVWTMPYGFQPSRTIYQNNFTIKHDSRYIRRSRVDSPRVGDTWSGVITTWITNAAWPGGYPSIT